jgi:hypothetical protein
MHGLTGNHDAAMAMTHPMPAASAVHDPVPAAAHVAGNNSSAAAHSTNTARTHAVALVVESGPPPAGRAVTVEASSDGHLH